MVQGKGDVEPIVSPELDIRACFRGLVLESELEIRSADTGKEFKAFVVQPSWPTAVNISCNSVPTEPGGLSPFLGMAKSRRPFSDSKLTTDFLSFI